MFMASHKPYNWKFTVFAELSLRSRWQKQLSWEGNRSFHSLGDFRDRSHGFRMVKLSERRFCCFCSCNSGLGWIVSKITKDCRGQARRPKRAEETMLVQDWKPPKFLVQGVKSVIRIGACMSALDKMIAGRGLARLSKTGCQVDAMRLSEPTKPQSARNQTALKFSAAPNLRQ